MGIDPMEIAKTELAKAMVPTPDDIMEMLSPIAALYYLEQLGWGTFRLWTAYAQDEVGKDPDAEADLAETLQGIGVSVGAIDAVAARIGLIPPEAVNGAPS